MSSTLIRGKQDAFLSLRNAIIGYKPQLINKLIESSVFQHIIRMGYNVYVGKTGDKEIDFVCEPQGEKIYIQCACLLTDDQTIEREFGNLMLIKDNYPKFVVTMKIAGSISFRLLVTVAF